jgi:hypothetical protein
MFRGDRRLERFVQKDEGRRAALEGQDLSGIFLRKGVRSELRRGRLAQANAPLAAPAQGDEDPELAAAQPFPVLNQGREQLAHHHLGLLLAELEAGEEGLDFGQQA